MESEKAMLHLSPLTRRITYVVIFETLAIIFATLILTALAGGEAHNSFPVAVASSTIALIWNFIYNTGFERWERRANITRRTPLLRAGHALGFEGGLVLVLVPVYMWWYQIGPIDAVIMEAALLVFFLVYTFIFTWIFDLIVLRTDLAPTTA